MLKQVVKLEDNRELVQDQTLKHSDSRELRCKLNKLVKNMETKSHRTEHICPLTLKTFMTKVLFLKQEAT